MLRRFANKEKAPALASGGCGRSTAADQALELDLSVEVDLERQRSVERLIRVVERIRVPRGSVRRIVAGSAVEEPGAGLRSDVLETVGRVGAHDAVRLIRARPWSRASAEAGVDYVGQRRRKVDLRRYVVSELQAHVQLPRLAILAETVEVPRLRIRNGEVAGGCEDRS